MNDGKLAAVFIDFENLYYTLTNSYKKSYEAANEATISMIGNALEELRGIAGEFIIRMAFADWGRLSEPKRELQRMGIRIVDVLSTEYKNSADIELSLSAQDVILTREDIETITIFAGDRDYMPIANRIREKGKKLHFVGFESNLSGDLKKLIGEGNYSHLDIETCSISGHKRNEHPNVQSIQTSVKGVALSPDQIKAAEAAIEAFDEYSVKYGSVKIGGFLVDRLAKALPNCEHLERKAVFRSLESLGMLTTEITPDLHGVFKINENSQLVVWTRKNLSRTEW